MHEFVVNVSNLYIYDHISCMNFTVFDMFRFLPLRLRSWKVARWLSEPDHAVEVRSGAARRMAGAFTCSNPFSLVSPRFEPRSIKLGPAGPEGGPAGRALAMVVGAGSTISCGLGYLVGWFGSVEPAGSVGPDRSSSLESNILKWGQVMTLKMSSHRLAVKTSERLLQQYPVTASMIQSCHVTVLDTGSVGLNGAGDDPEDEFTPTGGEDV
ncbi:hypothetical protein F511_39644 [Dorcoceras hygrometricum]|uniref:Uncharacterized protein n=1 Tax=Dorcoceras hygrometricum TaxID=472368 RepID=A0A2Z7ARL5_9LAMI|nr:hypothetical protein F511_39644 [Dorcoceras hygrometricum]